MPPILCLPPAVKEGELGEREERSDGAGLIAHKERGGHGSGAWCRGWEAMLLPLSKSPWIFPSLPPRLMVDLVLLEHSSSFPGRHGSRQPSPEET